MSEDVEGEEPETSDAWEPESASERCFEGEEWREMMLWDWAREEREEEGVSNAAGDDDDEIGTLLTA